MRFIGLRGLRVGYFGVIILAGLLWRECVPFTS